MRSASARVGNRRLLALNHFANPPDAPGGTRMIELAAHLDGWDTLVLAADRNLFTRRRRRVHTPGFRTVPTLPYAGNGPARVANWASYLLSALLVGLRGPRPDVVLGSSPHLLAPLAAWMLARARGAALVVEVRDLWPQVLVDTGRLSPSSPTHRALRALEGFLYARADAIVVLTAGVRADLLARGVPAEKVHLVPNGASPEDLTPRHPRDVVRAAHGWDGLIAIYAGAHGPANGLDALVDAAAPLAASHPEVRLVLVGDGVEKPRLAARVASEGHTNVELLAPVPKDEVADLLAAADVGLHVLADVPLFRYGVSPNKLFDYLAAGLPVVTNTAGEVADTVRLAGAGLAVAVDELAAGIAQVADAGPEGRAEWGAAGQRWLVANRSRAQMASLLAEALDAATRARRQPMSSSGRIVSR